MNPSVLPKLLRCYLFQLFGCGARDGFFVAYVVFPCFATLFAVSFTGIALLFNDLHCIILLSLHDILFFQNYLRRLRASPTTTMY